MFCATWTKQMGKEIRWLNKHDGGPHEAGFLKLDCGKLKQTFGWTPQWDIEMAVEKIVEWEKSYLEYGEVEACMRGQIGDFINADSLK